jgi:hypothetical protein
MFVFRGGAGANGRQVQVDRRLIGTTLVSFGAWGLYCWLWLVQASGHEARWRYSSRTRVRPDAGADRKMRATSWSVEGGV